MQVRGRLSFLACAMVPSARYLAKILNVEYRTTNSEPQNSGHSQHFEIRYSLFDIPSGVPEPVESLAIGVRFSLPRCRPPMSPFRARFVCGCSLRISPWASLCRAFSPQVGHLQGWFALRWWSQDFTLGFAVLRFQRLGWPAFSLTRIPSGVRSRSISRLLKPAGHSPARNDALCPSERFPLSARVKYNISRIFRR